VGAGEGPAIPTKEHAMDYQAQAARDAQASGYGGQRYCDYLEQAALEHRDYFLRHGEADKAAEMLTRSLSEALMGNEGA
jgi:hypothetical protein